MRAQGHTGEVEINDGVVTVKRYGWSRWLARSTETRFLIEDIRAVEFERKRLPYFSAGATTIDLGFIHFVVGSEGEIRRTRSLTGESQWRAIFAEAKASRFAVSFDPINHGHAFRRIRDEIAKAHYVPRYIETREGYVPTFRTNQHAC